MHLALRIGAIAVAVLGSALWFFGGMNPGPTQTAAPRDYLVPTPDGHAAEGRRDFRPGSRFLLGCLGLSVALAGASWCLKPARKAGRDGSPAGP